MERGPLALFGAIIAVGLGPALWMGVQLGGPQQPGPARAPAANVQDTENTRQDQLGGSGAGADSSDNSPVDVDPRGNVLPLTSEPTADPSPSATTTPAPTSTTTAPPTEPARTTAPPTEPPTTAPSTEPTADPTDEATEPPAGDESDDPTPSDDAENDDSGNDGSGGDGSGSDGSGSDGSGSDGDSTGEESWADQNSHGGSYGNYASSERK